jgi:lysozyme family protein
MDFDKAVEIIIKIEGGYSSDPHDAGGETNFGISKRVYPHVDIKNLTRNTAKRLYAADYWRAAKCDELPDQLKLLVFDCAVNQGQPTALKLLQLVLGVKQDTIFGEQTRHALKLHNPEDLAVRFMTARTLKYLTLPNFNRFGDGWLNRLFTITALNSII